MCGRYTLTVDPETIYGVFGIDDADDPDQDEPHRPPAAPYGGDPVRPRYNIAPTDQVPVVLNRSTDGDRAAPVRRLEPMRWGLIPGWAKDLAIGSRQFNVRAETLSTKFRSALDRRRCLVPASGFYEWQRAEGPAATAGATSTGRAGDGRRPGSGKTRGGAKQAYYLTSPDGSLLALAGLWEFWRPADGEPVRSMGIVTVPAVGRMRLVHDRMPLMLPPEAWEAWLSLTGGADSVADLLRPPDEDVVDELEYRPVGDRVGNVRNDDAELVRRVEPVIDLDGAPTGVEPPAEATQTALFS